MTDAEKVILSRNNTYYQNIWECFLDRRKSVSKALTKALKGGYDVNFIPRGSLRKPILLVVLGHTGKSEAKDVKLLLDAGADVFHRGLCLPSDNKMEPWQQDCIIEAVRRCFE